MEVADKKEKGKGKGKKEALSLKHCGEEEEEAKEEAPGAPYEMENLGFELFDGREDSKCRESRLGLPTDGPMVNETLGLLEDSQLPVKRDSPQQYVATIPQLPNSRVFFQDSEEIVKNLSSGHLDIGIVGLHTVCECGQGNDDLIIVHDDLGYGHCHLSLAIPKIEIFERISSVKELAQMPQWTEKNPLRVVTCLPKLGCKFMKEHGLKHVSISTARGPLEAAPAIGTAHVILNLVSSKRMLEDNNLKEIEGGTALKSQAVLVASRKSLVQRGGFCETTREILEILEARLKAVVQVKVITYMRGTTEEEVLRRVLSQPSLSILQEITVKSVVRICGVEWYKIACCVPKKELNSSVEQLKAIGCSPVDVSPVTYIFDKVPRWQQLLFELGL